MVAGDPGSIPTLPIISILNSDILTKRLPLTGTRFRLVAGIAQKPGDQARSRVTDTVLYAGKRCHHIRYCLCL